MAPAEKLAFSFRSNARFCGLQIAGECRPRTLQQPQNLLHLRVRLFEQSGTAATLDLSSF